MQLSRTNFSLIKIKFQNTAECNRPNSLLQFIQPRVFTSSQQALNSKLNELVGASILVLLLSPADLRVLVLLQFDLYQIERERHNLQNPK